MQKSGNILSLRLATYNILNTKDRYDEREQLLKQNIYELNADVVGLQEVVFGEEQLSELAQPKGKRTTVEGWEHSFHGFEAHVQQQIFKLKNNPDPRAKLDGNAILLSLNPTSAIKPQMVVDHRTLHLSGTRNCHVIKIDPFKEDGIEQSEGKSRFIYFVNTHLHDLMEDDYVRKLQAEQMLFWVDQFADFTKDLVVIVGDFNAKPDSKTYRHFVDRGYVSAHAHANGAEPELTFPTGLQAEFMDTDPPGTFDYIFLKGNGFTIKHAEVLGRKCDERDSTIYGSDHVAIAADIDIEL